MPRAAMNIYAIRVPKPGRIIGAESHTLHVVLEIKADGIDITLMSPPQENAGEADRMARKLNAILIAGGAKA